ncbi:tumor necrosis factor receptor superfamily member 5-like [Cottoperca gobio]|uniref:Tumor necrosis factor receptor superfamily member 5-like n=1 Tax=Cottoperca gobio TaxID=56716 RepID=A0A6J2RFG5_COTGO|nr:tumor necrosis factor receptor superfamily member 5-like [Cottoperca gobio]
MDNLTCPNLDKYSKKDGTCCDRCAAGQYMQTECDGTKTTKCAECGRGFYTAAKNHLSRCPKCKDCSFNNNQRKVKDCTAQKDTVCECVAGFYCRNDQCEHCQQVTHCPLGKGVNVQATRTTDTICAPCEDGTYSNVTDFQSPCRTHTRCGDFGKVLKTPGTETTDAICGTSKFHCAWILPAGLWSGLVLTALVLFGIMYWRAKRKSYKAVKKETTKFLKLPFKSTEAGSSVSITMAPALFTQLELPLPLTELNGHCQESCELPLYNPDDNVVSCGTQDSVDSSLTITPLKASVSFAESTHTNGSAGFCTGKFLRTCSEPQEDEWCGT